MRFLALAAFAAAMFLTTIPTDANAVVCARGVFRAGCAGPVVVCPTVWVNGVKVHRCG